MKIEKKCNENKSRIGKIVTSHGCIQTPVFIPVGTQGTVKTLSNNELHSLDIDVFIANAYHLYLRPGTEIISSCGGIHKFIGWNKSILTDSGGYQLYSLATLRKITNDGVEFRSHIDGGKHFFSPEKVIEIQSKLGGDIIMCFDECVPYPCDYGYAKQSVNLTTVWAERCKKKFVELENVNGKQFLFGIIQGATYQDLRKKSVEEIVNIEFDGYAIGGLSVGEPRSAMYEIIDNISSILPDDKPRYAMGVGTPEDIWFAVENGIDMFDCVLPTRNGRNGQALTPFGKLNIKNACFDKDFNPIDTGCNCAVCQTYSRAYIHHLFHSGELLGLKLLTLHNLNFMVRLMSIICKAIKKDRFEIEKKKFLDKYTNSK